MVSEGQIAHINHKRDDNSERNLAYLCLPHHSQYDSKSIQSKQLTTGELIYWKKELEEIVPLIGQHGEIEAEIIIDQRLEEFSAELFFQKLQSKVLLGGRIKIKMILRGSVKLVVSIDPSDLALLMRAFHRKLLTDLLITSIVPTVKRSALSYRTYDNWGALGTFSKSQAIRLEDTADYVQELNVRQYMLRFSVTYLSTNRDVVALTQSTFDGASISISEPLVVSKKYVSEWAVSSPLKLLQTYLTENSLPISQVGFEDAHLVIDRPLGINELSIMHYGFEGALIRYIKPSQKIDGRCYWDIRGRHVVILYFIPTSERNKMRSIVGRGLDKSFIEIKIGNPLKDIH